MDIPIYAYIRPVAMLWFDSEGQLTNAGVNTYLTNTLQPIFDDHKLVRAFSVLHMHQARSQPAVPALP